VKVRVGVAVLVAVRVGVAVLVGVEVAVAVAVGVAVEVGVGVKVGALTIDTQPESKPVIRMAISKRFMGSISFCG
jgi:hypothetical protein